MPHYPHKHRNYQWHALIVIMIVAFVFRFQHIKSIPAGFESFDGPWLGLLTVLGLFFLARELLNWQIAAFASFLMAVSHWPVSISRSSSSELVLPLLFVWGLYFIWKGKRSTKFWDFGVGGVFLGLAFYTSRTYLYLLPPILVTLAAYWHFIKKNYSHDRYLHTRNQLTRGFALTMVVALLVAAPLGLRYYLGLVSVSTITTDQLAGRPDIFWPIGILFLLGLLHSITKILRHHQAHGHHPTVPVLLLSWLLAGLYAPSAIVLAPVVMIIAGEGLWYLYDFCHKWYRLTDVHEVVVHDHHAPESRVIAAIAVNILLLTIMLYEYRAYFDVYKISQ